MKNDGVRPFAETSNHFSHLLLALSSYGTLAISAMVVFLCFDHYTLLTYLPNLV